MCVRMSAACMKAGMLARCVASSLQMRASSDESSGRKRRTECVDRAYEGRDEAAAGAAAAASDDASTEVTD